MTGDFDQRPDVRLYLPEVTLVAVSSIAIDATLRALRLSMQQCQFGAALFLSDKPPPIEPGEAIEWRAIPPIASRDAYSLFMLGELHRYIATRHALCVQWDGYVLRASGWDHAFLDYDYIGAPWPHFDDSMTVGNGGFSLRSQRLLAATAGLRRQTGEAEDITICRTNRSLLETSEGIRFAPPELARKFAFERHWPRGEEFGFHGAFNMVDLASRHEISAVVAALEPQVMASSEHWELLRWAVRKCHVPLALAILRRIRHRNAGTG